MPDPVSGTDEQTGSAGVTPSTGPPPAIELKDINKSFGPVRANKNVNLFVRPGTIHGIVGENGAGKSTLMSILYGFYEADRGEIFITGEKVRIDSSQAAIAAGIGMVHQHFMLVNTFSVLENVHLDGISHLANMKTIWLARVLDSVLKSSLPSAPLAKL